jgi:ferrous iron transport protein B
LTNINENKNTNNPIKLVLVGNPNVGKSIFFNYLTGKYVDVSNFPGTTVEVYQGKYKDFEIYDTPGIYSVSTFNDEERVAKEYVLNSDLIINIVDANHLERDLFLTLQLLDMGKKIILVLNIVDELEKNNISINYKELSDILNVQVIPTVAPDGKGLQELESAISSHYNIKEPEGIETKRIDQINASKAEKVLILEGDESLSKKYNVPEYPKREDMFFERRKRVNEVVSRVILTKSGKTKISSMIGLLSIHPVYGVLFGLVILYFVYLFIGVFVAGKVVDYTKISIGTELYENNVKKYISLNANTRIITSGYDENGNPVKTLYEFPDGTEKEISKYNEILRLPSSNSIHIEYIFNNPVLAILFGEFGIITMTVSYIFFLLLPLVFGFYFMLSLLEDSGYLPRIATLVDKLLSYMGLNGRAVIPIILGFGCVTMATITTRMLGSKRERTIATTILQLAIPCSAQLGVIATLLARTSLKITIIYTVIIFIFLALVGTIMSKFIRGETTPLLIDLPQMRIPRPKNVFKKTLLRSYGFMKEASPWFLFGAITISVLQISGALESIIDFIHPIVVHWLKLPREAGIALVMGLVRRDFGAAGLYDLNLAPYQILIALITLTLFVPCVTSLIIMFKERGMKEGILIWIASLSLAFLLGGIIAQIVI